MELDLAANGNIVTGGDITSDSGFDYTMPISQKVTPEPDSWLLTLSGRGLIIPGMKARCHQANWRYGCAPLQEPRGRAALV